MSVLLHACVSAASDERAEEQPFKLQFCNDARTAMELWWDPANGLSAATKVLQAKLQPGRCTTATTFAGHTFDWVHPDADWRVARRVHVFRGLEKSVYREDQDVREARSEIDPVIWGVPAAPTGAAVSAPGSVQPVDATVDCEDRVSTCIAHGSERGECLRNPGWMVKHCGRSCGMCHLRSPTERCSGRFLNMSDAATAWSPPTDGRLVTGMAQMFDTMGARLRARYPQAAAAPPPPPPPTHPHVHLHTAGAVQPALARPVRRAV